MSKIIGRRRFLRVAATSAAAAPIAGKAVAQEMGNMALANGVSPAGLARGGMGVGGPAQDAPKRVTSLLQWLTPARKAMIRREVRDIYGFDPDILTMRLPIATKVRMQRERQYKRRLEDMERAISLNGAFEWWGA